MRDYCLKDRHLLLQALDRIKKAAPKKEGKKDKAGSSTKKEKDNAGPTISEDDAKRLEKEVSCMRSDSEGLSSLFSINLVVCMFQIDDLTKKFIKSAEDMCKAKEKEIRGG